MVQMDCETTLLTIKVDWAAAKVIKLYETRVW